MYPGATSLQGLGDACYRQGAGYVQLYENHVHCDWRSDSLDTDFYRTMKAKPSLSEPFLSARIESRDGLLSAPATGWDEGEPLRRWFAYDDLGDLIAESTSRTFEVPDNAVSAEVIVGFDTRAYLEL